MDGELEKADLGHSSPFPTEIGNAITPESPLCSAALADDENELRHWAFRFRPIDGAPGLVLGCRRKLVVLGDIAVLLRTLTTDWTLSGSYSVSSVDGNFARCMSGDVHGFSRTRTTLIGGRS